MTDLATAREVSDGGAANWLRDFVSRGGQKKSDGECLLKAASKMDELSFEQERLLERTGEMSGHIAMLIHMIRMERENGPTKRGMDTAIMMAEGCNKRFAALVRGDQ